jgi:predicted TIM-barrel fold metal-dependent hydrolase
MRRVDAHVHLVPEQYRSVLEQRAVTSLMPPVWSEELMDGFMDRHGIDAAVLSLAPPGVSFGDPGLARELARIVNERIATLASATPERFAGLAVLPLPDVDQTLAEIAYAYDVLGLDGVILPSNVDGIYLGADALAPVLDELDRREAYVLLHPSSPPGPPALPQYPVWLHEFPFDTTRAVIDLIYSGTLERCRRLRIQVAHLGGVTPFLVHRIASLQAREPHLAERAPAGAAAYLRGLFYDTGLSNHADVVTQTASLVGEQRIVFGTDWPYAALPDGGDPAPDLAGLGQSERIRLTAHHVAALVPRFAAS